MRKRFRGLALVALAAPGACATVGPAGFPGGSGGVNSPAHRDAPYLVVVSFDGFRHDYIERHSPPNLLRLAARGVRAESLIPVFPTKTFPNHYSIATGMYAESHGLVDNLFYDPALQTTYTMSERGLVEDPRFYGGEPIWVTAERQRMVAASYFWVGTEAPVDGVRPSIWKPYDATVPNHARVDSALAWLARPAAVRPHLVMLYFSDVDDAGHEFGPDSPEVAAAVAEVDRALGRLLDGLARLPHGDRVNVIVVSDHGMADVEADSAIVLSQLVTLEDARVLGGGPYIGAYFTDPARAARVDSLLDARLPRAAASYLGEEMPDRLHYERDPRIPDLLVLAEEPWIVVRDARALERDWGGAHGYDNRNPNMHGIFVAAGPDIARVPAPIASFENIHIYPFATAVLGLAPNARVDGRLDVLGPFLDRAVGR
ncbi:MAG: ectonucleotide pyrophosphatase/phosphodiesterase [Longimicrobiales bacterium]